MNDSSITDEKLLQHYKAGDEHAFYELFRRYEKPVISYLFGMTGNLEQSKDVCQETFLKLINKPPTFFFGGSLKSWLFRSARNRMIDVIRRESKKQALDDFVEQIDSLPDPQEKLSKHDDFTELNSVMEQLEDKFREVVVLYYFSEMTYKEIAKVMGIPIGTALWRMQKAISQMQDIYENKK